MKTLTLTSLERALHSIAIVVATLLCLSLASCNKDDQDDDDDNPEGYLITATIANGNSDIALVKAQVDDDVVLATAKYSKGGFTISLPNPSSRYLEEFYDNTYACTTDFYAYDDDDDPLGQLLYAKVSSSGLITLGLYLYIGDDLEMYASDEGITFDLSCTKGWNLLYIISSDPDLETGTLTTNQQSGLEWRLYADSGTYAGTLRSAANRLSSYIHKLNTIKR
jgi:hypothetical protein